MGFDKTANPAQVPQAKNGEQLPSGWRSFSFEVTTSSSLHWS